MINKNFIQFGLHCSLVICILIISSFNTLARAEHQQSRFVPGVESIIESHQFLQKYKAAPYWHISPYYLSQLTGSSCSLASTTMVMNAIRSYQKLTANEPLVTQDALLARVNNNEWRNGVKQEGEGATLKQLEHYITTALARYGLHHFNVAAIEVENTSKHSAIKLHKVLLESETSDKIFIIANFDQQIFTRGALSAGHFAPIGAYDLSTHRALIMDPDRTFYEPYWVPEKLLLKSMATHDKVSKHHRGYLVIRLTPNE